MPETKASPIILVLLPMMVALFVGYLVTGMALPVLPLHVHTGLGQSSFVVGLVAGSQFAAALLSRFWAGHYADSKGAKRATVVGLFAATVSGLIYLASLLFSDTPAISAAILVLGRGVLGGAESFIITGALGWGLALAGSQNAGKVIALVGMAMYIAFAVGAPIGSALYAHSGFAAISLATAFIPLAALALIAPLQPVAPHASSGPPVAQVVKAVWLPGICLAFSSVGFGSMTTFVVLLFAERGWNPVWLPFTLFSASFVVGRLFFGHLPDRIGGVRVAVICVLIEAAGQLVLWLAPSSAMGLAGAVLTGLGYSLVYPGFGVEAVRRVPPQSRALAMGAYTAFLDLTLGVANPALGLLAGVAGQGAVFAASALLILCSAVAALGFLRRAPADRAPSTTIRTPSPK